MWTKVLKALAGQHARSPRKPEIERILAEATQLQSATTEQLQAKKSLAAGIEAARRALGYHLFPTQVHCALALCEGRIAEMQTGEGKTLAAMPAAALLAQAKRGVHVLTANDYLARRDAEWMEPAYKTLGLTVGHIHQSSTFEERRDAYNKDVTYVAATEAGFDHLRDCRALTLEDQAQRPLHAVIVDEADSILIDEARIPLVLAGESDGDADRARHAGPAARALRAGIDYELDWKTSDVRLTLEGYRLSELLLNTRNLHEIEGAPLLGAIYHALHAQNLLTRDVDYLVADGHIIPIDAYKGRLARQRRWPAGIHAALEEKEGLEVQDPGRVLASVTLQNYLLQYEHLCGMTGTAASQADEFWRIYNLEVEVVPTHKPMIRLDHPDRLFRTRAAKEQAICDEIRALHAEGRPVLIGTDSVEASTRLSRLLPDVPHAVLNATNEVEEAGIIAHAGQRGVVTVSTNMAGRGVDILLGPGVAQQGGLHVIGACRHDSRRIDNQLRGRAGRQGDPGSSRFYVSFEDDLIARYLDEGEEAKTIADCNGLQRRAEGRQLDARLFLHRYESILEGQRHAVLQQRQTLLESPGNETRIQAMDEAWAWHLDEVANQRTGFTWFQMGGREPLNRYLTTIDELFQQLWANVDQLEAEAETTPLRRGAIWTYLTVDQPLGTPMARIMKGLARKAKSGSLWG